MCISLTESINCYIFYSYDGRSTKDLFKELKSFFHSSLVLNLKIYSVAYYLILNLQYNTILI